ncbi:MAG: hypothetical protein V7637_3905 [Mycobacteriales bacterium]
MSADRDAITAPRPTAQPAEPAEAAEPTPPAQPAQPARPAAGGRPRRVVRWVAGLLLGALLGWMVLVLVSRARGGTFWLWGLPDPAPVLLYFLGPPAALAGVAMLVLARTGWPRRDRAAVSLAAAPLGMIVLHLLLTGRTWLWVLPDLAPPILLFLAAPLTLLAGVGAARLTGHRLTRPAGRAVLLLGLTALGLGVDQAGLNLALVTGGGSAGAAPAGALRVVSWDTFTWDRRKGPAPFYQFLHAQRADVYLLQGYPGPFRPLRPDDPVALRREFPGFAIAQVGDLVTVSRFPIVAQRPLWTAQPPGTDNIDFVRAWQYGALRTDVAVGDRIVSVYNAHFYDQFAFGVGPLTPAFYRNVRGLTAGRRSQFDRLRADLLGNPNPAVVGGNLNTLPNNGDLRRLGPLTDASRASRSLYPTTFRFVRLRLWRMDWIFVSRGVAVHSYDLVDPHRLSTRSLQRAVLSLPGD